MSGRKVSRRAFVGGGIAAAAALATIDPVY